MNSSRKFVCKQLWWRFIDTKFLCLYAFDAGIDRHFTAWRSFGKCNVAVAAIAIAIAIAFVHLIAPMYKRAEKIVLAHIHIHHIHPEQYAHPHTRTHPSIHKYMHTPKHYVYMSINDHSTTLYVLSAFYLFTIFLFPPAAPSVHWYLTEERERDANQ